MSGLCEGGSLLLSDADAHPPDGGWVLYLLECVRGSATGWYAGITNDLPRRVRTHLSGKGARYTRARPPVRLIGVRSYANRSEASRAEYGIRQCRNRAEKLCFITGGCDERAE